MFARSDVKFCTEKAVEFLAWKHDVTVDQIVSELTNANKTLADQLSELLKLGLNALADLEASTKAAEAANA